MRFYIIIFIVSLFILGCGTDVEEPGPSNESPDDEPSLEPEDTKELNDSEVIIDEVGKGDGIELEEIKSTNEIKILDEEFSPDYLKLDVDSEVTFIQSGEKRHKIACYLGPTRVFLSDDLQGGSEYSFTFTEKGEYSCVDAVYGLRSTIVIGDPKPRDAITAMAVVSQDIPEDLVMFYVPIVLIGIIAIIAFIISRRTR
ncbi:hypothetical protein ACFLZX_01510 [Nanoarchaeota archaeon]